MDINHLTLGEIRELLALFPGRGTQVATNDAADALTVKGAWEIGANYLIRTVTMIDTGRLVNVTPHELVLQDAAWIADTGRFADALRSCEFAEVEPFPDGTVIIGRGSVIDAVKINRAPRDQK